MDRALSFLGAVVHEDDGFVVVVRVRFKIARQHLTGVAGAYDEDPRRGRSDAGQPFPENPDREPDATQEDDTKQARQEDDGTRIRFPPQEHVHYQIHGDGRGNARAYDELEIVETDVAPQASLDSEHPETDRKSTRLNSSHTVISYAVFCLKKKK